MSDYQTAKEIIYDCGERVYNLESGIRVVCEERDELKRRLDAVVEMLRIRGASPYENGMPIASYEECFEWSLRGHLYDRAKAIAEGKHNGT